MRGSRPRVRSSEVGRRAGWGARRVGGAAAARRRLPHGGNLFRATRVSDARECARRSSETYASTMSHSDS